MARPNRRDHPFPRSRVRPPRRLLAVQAGAGPSALLDAVKRLQESVGVDAAARERIAARLDALRFDAHAGPLVLGLVVGLLAAEVE